MLEVGTDAPTFTLPNQDGEAVDLTSFAGQWVVVYFYPRADTTGCTTEAKGIRDAWDAFTSRDIAVLGISDDPVADLDDFAQKYDLPFELLSDESGTVATQYESYGEKQVYGNTVMGVFRNTYVIDPEGQIALSYRGVSPERHAEELLEDIPATA